MRLFIAINFNEETKQKIFNISQRLKKYSAKGNFTSLNNIHLTLHFLGEVENAENIKSVLDKINNNSFKIKFGDIGFFKRYGGNICYLSIEKNNELDKLYNSLKSALEDIGFETENRPFKPHLTLARQTDIDYDGKIKENFSYEVTKISLMKSERKQGILKYTEIYSKNLN